MSQYGNVTILGTGIMGTALARRLAGAGVDVTVWNRTVERAEPLVDDDVTVALSPAAAVADADIVLLTLFDADAVLEVVRAAADAAPATATWVQMSTIGIDGTEQVVRTAHEHGLALVEAMMLGTKGPAESGSLVLLTAGAPELLAQVEPVLALVSAKRVHAGALGAAARLKLVCNTWIGLLTAGTAQALAMAEALGLAPDLFLQAIAGGQSDSPYAHAKGALMVADDYQPANFQLHGLHKDLDLAAAAVGAGRSYPILEAVRDLYAAAEERGQGDQDIAAVFRAFDR